MSSLLLVGNIRQETFANAILAAHIKIRDGGGKGLSDVFVLHSPRSERFLSENREWQQHLIQYGITSEIFVSATVDLHAGGDQQLSLVAHHVERFLLALDQRNDVYVDLTNGSSHYKSVLANIAFVIGVRRPFILNTEGPVGFLNPEALREAYVELPDPSLLDTLAPVWLTEVRRFNVQSQQITAFLEKLESSTEIEQDGFTDDIRNAIQAWFRGEKHEDGAALGGAVRHIGRAFEDIIRAVYRRIYPEEIGGRKSVHQMLVQIRTHLAGLTGDYDPELLEDVSQLLRRLRNASTHERQAADFGHIRARLAIELLLETAELFRIFYYRGLLERNTPSSSRQDTKQCGLEGRPGETYFFGIDGDDTGRELERLFQGNFEQTAFSRFSGSIEHAINSLAEAIKKLPIQGKVLFCSGDDLLFTGKYNAETLSRLRAQYSRLSGGYTCSIGFGRTPKEAYVALKMAKASPGKDTMMGVEIIQLEQAST